MKSVISVALYAVLSISLFSPRAMAASRIPKWAESLDSIIAELSNVENKQENFSKKADEITSHCMPNRYENFTNQHKSNKEALYINAKYLKKELQNVLPYTINSSDLDDSDLGKGAFDALLLDLQSKITILDTNIQKIRRIVNETSISAERLFCGSAKLYEEQMKENVTNNRPPNQKCFLDSAPTEYAKDEFVNCQSKSAKAPQYVLTSSYKAFSQKVFVNGFSTVVIGGNQAIHLIELRKKELQKFTKKIEKKRNSFK